MKWQRLWSVAVATVAMTVTGVAAGMANNYSFSEASIVVKAGSTTVASGTAKINHGYSQVSGRNHNTAVMTIRDRSSADGRAVYGKVTGQYRAYVRVAGINRLTWIGAGQQQSARTRGQLSTAMSVAWSPRTHYGLRTIANVCVDIRLRPDNCSGFSRTTNF